MWSLGHRNVQGLAFDSRGQLWASEFGQDTWDELNRIRKGGNYGWPVVEGKADQSPYIDPLVVWHPAEASPSGLAIVNDVAYLASLRGERLWQVPLVGINRGDAKALLVDGTDAGQPRCHRTGDLWLATSNRDGRGSPATNDDGSCCSGCAESIRQVAEARTQSTSGRCRTTSCQEAPSSALA